MLEKDEKSLRIDRVERVLVKERVLVVDREFFLL